MAASSAAIQLEISAMPATGAAVESTMNASFSRLTRAWSVMGRITGPTISASA